MMMMKGRRRLLNSFLATTTAVLVLRALCGNVALVEGTTVHVTTNSDSSGRRRPQPLTVAPLVRPSNENCMLTRGGGAAVMGLMNEPMSSKIVKKYTDDNQMPSLFGPEEEMYDRYAACLAATEGLRRIRDRDLAEERRIQAEVADSAAPTAGAQSGGGDLASATKRPVGMSEGEKHINSKYVQTSVKVLRALGMSLTQFNELGKQVSQDENLKEKIMEQAYLYRMAATINMDRTHLIDDPSSSELLKSFRKDKVQMFCESMTEIEQLRSDQMNRMLRALQIEKFPDHVNISDPSLAPFLNPKVRAVVEAFPFQAEEIVKRHGLEAEEFNQMLHATKSNPIFRWKIQRQIRNGNNMEEQRGQSQQQQQQTQTQQQQQQQTQNRRPKP